MEWYHTYLVHPGSTRMISTIQGIMHWHGMRKILKDMSKNVTIVRDVKAAKEVWFITT